MTKALIWDESNFFISLELINSLDLDWQEKLSLEYSNGLLDYWGAYNKYKRESAFRAIQDYIPLIACVGTAYGILTCMLEETNRGDKHAKNKR